MANQNKNWGVEDEGESSKYLGAREREGLKSCGNEGEPTADERS